MLTYTCKECGHEYSVNTGIGFLYPTVCAKLRKRITAGEFGEDWQRVLAENPQASVETSDEVYICSGCGHWTQGEDIAIYPPEGDGPRRALKRLSHRCEKCGRRMHKMSRKELENLPCPKCGSAGQKHGYIMWD